MTNDGDNHLISLSINVNDKNLHAATGITSASHPILDSQGSNKPFPVNILLDTGSLRPDGKYIHKDVIDIIEPLNIHSKRSTNSTCGELNNSCKLILVRLT